MALFLQIIIGCLVAIAIVAILGVVAFALFMRNLKNALNAPDSKISLAIHLHEDLAPEWLESKQTQPLVNEFEQHGFTAGKAYTIEEMEQVKCLSLFHERFVAVLYNVENHGPFFDIMHMSSESAALTVTTSPFSADLDSPPDLEKISLQGVGLTEAMDLIIEKTEGCSTYMVNNDNFRETVETYYKIEQAYRNRNGGMSFDEFKTIMDKEPKKYKDDHVRQGFIELKKNEMETWSDAGLDEYFEKSEIDENDRYSGGCYFVVPIKTDAEAFIHYLNDYELVSDEHVEKVGVSVRTENNIIALFDRINNSRSPDLRAQERGVISFPVEGRVYQLAG